MLCLFSLPYDLLDFNVFINLYDILNLRCKIWILNTGSKFKNISPH